MKVVMHYKHCSSELNGLVLSNATVKEFSSLHVWEKAKNVGLSNCLSLEIFLTNIQFFGQE